MEATGLLQVDRKETSTQFVDSCLEPRHRAYDERIQMGLAVFAEVAGEDRSEPDCLAHAGMSEDPLGLLRRRQRFVGMS